MHRFGVLVCFVRMKQLGAMRFSVDCDVRADGLSRRCPISVIKGPV
jgi:hypothetical protein